MQVTTIESNVVRVRGDAYDSAVTVYLSGVDALIVDALGSKKDAEALRELVMRDLGARVRFVIATHYLSDHMAGLATFPEAHIIAHRDHRQTYDQERARGPEERAFYVAPTIEIDSELVLRWGGFTFQIFANPGHTMSTLNVEVPEADVLHVGDNVVGNVVHLSYTSPVLIRRAVTVLLRRRRGRVMSGHGPANGPESLESALAYLGRLESRARDAWWATLPAKSIARIPIGDCLAPGIEPTEFEATLHEKNLVSIIDGRLFERL